MKYLLFLLTILLAAPAGADQLRVMCWNLADMDLFDGNGTERVEWQKAAENSIASVLRDINPDLCLIVESPSFTELTSFVTAQNLNYHVSHVRQQSGNRNFADGMALLSKQPPRSVQLLTPPVPGSDRGPGTAYLDWSYRGLLQAEINGLTLIGVHLKSPWDGRRRSYDMRDAQARALISHTQNTEGPLLVLGDFNDEPGVGEKESEFGLPDTIAVLSSYFFHLEGDEITQEKNLNLDHIFIRDANAGPRRVVQTDWTVSDHRPVWTDILF